MNSDNFSPRNTSRTSELFSRTATPYQMVTSSVGSYNARWFALVQRFSSVRQWLGAAIFVSMSVPGVALEISDDAVWGVDGSPYEFSSDVVVRAGATLTMEPGVVVRFGTEGGRLEGEEPGAFLRIEGTLVVTGSARQPVRFEGRTGELDEWGGIVFESSSQDAEFDAGGRYLAGSVIYNAQIRHAGASGVFADSASPYLCRVLFENNASLYDKGEEIVVDEAQGALERIMGGAVYLYRPDAPARIKGCVFKDNHSLHVGGALAIAESGDVEVVVEGCVFERNLASARGGGAIRLLGAAAQINGCEFHGNEAERGGAIHASYGSRMVLRNGTLSENSSLTAGGAVFIAHRCDAQVVRTVFEGNSVEPMGLLGGGAIHVHANGSVLITKSRFLDNEAPYGGAILFTNRTDDGDAPGIFCNQFMGNRADESGHGCAIEAIDWQALDVRGNIFGNDEADGPEAALSLGTFSRPSSGEVDVRENLWMDGTSATRVIAISGSAGRPKFRVGQDLKEAARCSLP